MKNFYSLCIDSICKLTKDIHIPNFILKFLKSVLVLILGLLSTLIFFEISLFTFGQSQKIISSINNSFSKKDEFVILCLGESTTASMERWGKDYSWPFFLEKVLNETGLDKKIKVINKGLIGANSNMILDDLEKNIEKYNPDLVISMMGVNDYGNIAFEESAEINNDSFKSKFRSYKLAKFLLKNIEDKYDKKVNCNSEIECIYLAENQSSDRILEMKLARKAWTKALKYNPSNLDALLGLGFSYLSSHNLDEPKAMEYFQKVLEHDPKNINAYIGLINSIFNFSNNKELIEKIKIDIENNKIEDSMVFLSLADYEHYHDNENDRFVYLKKAASISPNNIYILHKLSMYCKKHKNFKEVEEIYLKILENNDINELSSAMLVDMAQFYQETGKKQLADKFFNQAFVSNDTYVKNYQTLYQKLKSKNIPLIAVQYPMRSVKPLQLILEEDSDVFIVDNEKNFQDLVRKEGYDQVFFDSFAGDFGHCTEKGNMFLAENILSVMLENWKEISSNK